MREPVLFALSVGLVVFVVVTAAVLIARYLTRNLQRSAPSRPRDEP